MPAAIHEEFDFFVSYSRKDNFGGWITGFIDALQSEQRKRTGGQAFRVFVDTSDIRSLDDWQHRIYESLTASRLLVAFISPNYFASEWCRREWRTWIDLEIAKHVLSDGAACICIVEVPWMGMEMSEQDVATRIAALGTPPVFPTDAAVRDATRFANQIYSRRQLTKLEPFYAAGVDALRREDLHGMLVRLAEDLDERASRVVAAERSPTNIPNYNKRFCGRLDELSKLRELLDDDHAGVVASVHGLGGMGKTELAFTYAHAFAGLYPGGRYLIPCEGRETLRHAALSLDDVFHDQIDDEERKTLETHFSAIRESLRRLSAEKGRILLVLDNVEDRQLLSPLETDHFAGFSGKLHILVTTRIGPQTATDNGGRIDWVVLDSLPEEDALDLIDKHRPFTSEAERESARRIVMRLGGFTLAVELVAAYLEMHPDINCAAFLERLGLEEMETLETLGADQSIELRRKHDEHRLSAVLEPTLASLSAPQRSAVQFAALLPPDHIVLPWLKELVGEEHPEILLAARPGHPDPWLEIERRLFSLTLLIRSQQLQGDPRVARCHRLVQDYMRHGMEKLDVCQERLNDLTKRRCAELLDTNSWPADEWEVPSLAALATQWAETAHPGSAWLLKHIGRFWLDLGSWSNAESVMRSALALDVKHFGLVHYEVAQDLTNLGWLLYQTDRYEEAEALMRQALTVAIESCGADSPEVAIRHSNLAQLLQDTDRLAEAEAQTRRALAIDTDWYGLGHEKTAIRQNNLAQILVETDRFAEAEPLMRSALATDERLLGVEHRRVARDLGNLGLLLMKTNRLADAEPLMLRALAIKERHAGNDHPDVASQLNNLAVLYDELNRNGEAETASRRALAIHEKSYGPDHSAVARDLNSLASILKKTNRPEEAEPLWRRALVIIEKVYGEDHSRVATILSNLAGSLHDSKKLDEAEPLYRRALSISEKSFGLDHSDVAIRLNNLSELLHTRKNFSEAESLAMRALEILEKSHGFKHPMTTCVMRNLALSVGSGGRAIEAEALMRDALRVDEELLGGDHPNVAIGLNNLAFLLLRTERKQEAEPLMRRQLLIILKARLAFGANALRDSTAVQHYLFVCEILKVPVGETMNRYFAIAVEAGLDRPSAQALLLSSFEK